MTKYKVQYHFDVWGNAKDGFEVNDSRSLEMELDLSSTRSLLKSLRAEFIIKTGSVRIVDIGAGLLYVDGKNGKPFLTIDLGLGNDHE